MQKPPIPENDSERVKSLVDLDIIETPIIHSFECLTQLTKTLFDVPMVAITLIDSERQWLKAKQGLDFCETSRDLSFCAYAINQDDIFIVNDTLLDSRFFDHPSVVNDPKIRFYAGYPILSPLGYKVGTVCIMDHKPRVFPGEKLSCLKDIGWLVEAEMAAIKNKFHQKRLMEALKDAKRGQLIDSLTRLWNRKGIEKLLIEHAQFAKKHQEEFGIAMVDIDNFKSVNDKYGHCAGDAVLQEVSRRMLVACRESDFIGRWGGEEFLVIINGNRPTELVSIAERLRKNVCDSMISYQHMLLPVSITIGLDIWHPANSLDIEKMVNGPDKAMYEGKTSGKNKVVCNFKVPSTSLTHAC